MQFTQGYLNSQLNITTQVVVKPAPGKLVSIVVSTGGTANIWDATAVGQVAGSAAQIAQLGAGTYLLPFPFLNGLVVQSTTAASSVAYE